MKIGIFTFPNSTSYGAALQMYALYRTVGQLGHEVEIINYHNAYMKAEKHMGSGRQGWKKTVKKTLRSVAHYRLYKSFRAFEERNLVRYPAKAFDRVDMLPEVGKRYGAVICGSDQVWNPDITGGDLSYFLDFCGEDTRRISYAPSFGIDSFSPAFCDEIQGELEKFYALSVRETPGQELVERLVGVKAHIVADPTFFLSSDDWKALEKPHPAAEGDYILYYTVRSSRSLWKHAVEFARKTGLKLVVVGGNPLKKRRDKNLEYAIDISPEQWLYLVRHARYVVTNSFHGTAFSINFRKDFYIEYSARTNSRLVQIVEAMGLTARVVGQEAIEEAATDYTVADRVLSQMRKESHDYLKQALE